MSATDGLWRELSDYARASRPSYLVGFASSIHRMACSIKHHQLEAPGSQRMLSAAEPLSDSQRHASEPYLGSAGFTTYGSREFMSLCAAYAERDGLRILAENLLVEDA